MAACTSMFVNSVFFSTTSSPLVPLLLVVVSDLRGSCASSSNRSSAYNLL